MMQQGAMPESDHSFAPSVCEEWGIHRVYTLTQQKDDTQSQNQCRFFLSYNILGALSNPQEGNT